MIIGQRFTRLLVVAEAHTVVYGKNPHKHYLCQCDCGNKVVAHPSNLHRGATKSCGCWKRESAGAQTRKHGMSRSNEYAIWSGIIQRCTNPDFKNFRLWGGRGITISEEWRNDFAAFYADMGPRPSKKHSIDRINNNDHYCKANCRWATYLQQSNNCSRTHLVPLNGQLVSLRQYAKAIGRDYYNVYHLVVRRGIPIDQLPVKERI